jgi:hypothetical protein
MERERYRARDVYVWVQKIVKELSCRETKRDDEAEYAATNWLTN